MLFILFWLGFFGQIIINLFLLHNRTFALNSFCFHLLANYINVLVNCALIYSLFLLNFLIPFVCDITQYFSLTVRLQLLQTLSLGYATCLNSISSLLVLLVKEVIISILVPLEAVHKLLEPIQVLVLFVPGTFLQDVGGTAGWLLPGALLQRIRLVWLGNMPVEAGNFASIVFHNLLLKFNIIKLIVMGQEVATIQEARTTPNSGQAQGRYLPHEGILKIQKTPFENCQKVQIGDDVYFLQQTKGSLDQVVKMKIKLRQRFAQEQITKLIQNVAYTLAFLETAAEPYPWLVCENIFRCSHSFKLLPPSAVKLELYPKLKQALKYKTKQYVPASPQLIIAARCHEPQIKQAEIMFKSNVFSLGLVLLEVCTLKPSAQCYDLENFDILDEVINERIDEIEGVYGDKVAMIVANMLDYDLDQRMKPKDLSIWLNRIKPVKNYLPTSKGSFSPKPDHQDRESTPQKKIAKSRLMMETEYAHSKNKQEQCLQKNNKPKPDRVKQTRLNEIRAKITREKLSNNIGGYHEHELKPSTSTRRIQAPSTSPQPHKKPLPNPYLNHNTKTNHSLVQKPQASPHRVSHSGSSVSPHVRDETPPRYRYQPQQGYSLATKNREINLKYKYNLNGSSREEQNNPLGSIERRDMHGVARAGVEAATRTQANRDYTFLTYEERELSKLKQQGDIYSDKERNNYYDQYMGMVHGRFNLELEKKAQPSTGAQKIMKRQQSQFIFKDRENLPEGHQQQTRVSDFEAEEPPERYPYQRHQKISFKNEAKPSKGYGKQNQDILLIKTQIQKSRRIIQQVKKSQLAQTSHE